MDAKAINSLQQAAKRFSAGDTATAEALCQTVLQRFPDSVDAIHLLALVHKTRGQSDEAERLFLDCLARDDGRADIHANLGNLYKSLGRLEEACARYRTALARNPGFRPAKIALARTLNEAGDHAEAEQSALDIVRSNPEDSQAWVVLAGSRRSQRQFAQAEADYRRALALNANYAVAHHNLGALLTQLNRHEEALKQLDLAASCGVDGSEICINRAGALLGLGRLQEAAELLQAQVSKWPEDVDALEFLAKIRFMRGEENFAAEFTAAATAHPANIALPLRLARLLQGAEDYQQAERVLHQSLAHNGPKVELYCALAAEQQLAGDYAGAAANAQRAAELAGHKQHSIDLSIDALMCLGRVEEARALIAEARTANPLNQWYLAMEATAARLRGDPLYAYLYDYDSYVKDFLLEPPPGWDSIAAFNADLIEVLKRRHQFEAHPLDQSLRHGTQTPTSLLWDDDPVIQAFLAALAQPIAAYRDSLGHDPKHPLQARNDGSAELIGCWSVRLHRGGYHVNHVHPEGWLSSAYYVETPAEIESTAERAGWIQFGEPRFPIAGAAPVKFVKPEAGKLVLFPSYMWHGTVPIRGDEARMTIAFDVVTRPARPPSSSAAGPAGGANSPGKTDARR